jgi:hypothetical protein
MGDIPHQPPAYQLKDGLLAELDMGGEAGQGLPHFSKSVHSGGSRSSKVVECHDSEAAAQLRPGKTASVG